ncbi:hypothetical protein ABW21_db0208038 [Orbilia brochopaga]|nr:hypothetical protein ABW21_db0208038 [Drechslerella brochopaga]
MVGGRHLLLAAVVPALVSSYQIGFQETAAIPDDPDSYGSPIEFTQYSNDDDNASPPCLDAPRFPTGAIEKVYLRNGPSDLRPPLAMAFFNEYNDPADPNNPPATACADSNFLFAVRWFPFADSEQTFTPPDGSFTNFQEIRLTDAAWSYVQDIGDGEIVYRDFADNPELFRGAVTYEQLFTSSSPELEQVPLNLDIPGRAYSEYTVDEFDQAADESASNDWFNTAPSSQSLSGQNSSPAGGRINSDTSGTLLGSQPGGTIRVPVPRTAGLHHNLLELMGLLDLPPDSFREQFQFERDFPDFYQMLVDQFIESRQGALNAGMYVPVPLGLILRYTDAELNEMGLERDPVLEIDAYTHINQARAEDPNFDVETPLLFRLFEGRTPGIFQAVFNQFIEATIQGMQREVDAALAADADTEPESNADDIVSDGNATPLGTTDPSVQGQQGGGVAEPNWRDELANEMVMEMQNAESDTEAFRTLDDVFSTSPSRDPWPEDSQ